MREYHLKFIASDDGGPRYEQTLGGDSAGIQTHREFQVFSALYGDGKSRYVDVTETVRGWGRIWPDNWEKILYATRKPRLVGVGGSDGGAVGSVSDNREDVSDMSLKIHSAVYGYDHEHKIDVTDRVRSLVSNNSLDIVVNNSTLTPNDNPFRGKKKTLSVQYSFDGGEKVLLQRQEKDWLIIGQMVGATGYAAVGSERTAQLINKRDGREGEVRPRLKCVICGRLTDSLMAPIAEANEGVCSEDCAEKWIEQQGTEPIRLLPRLVPMTAPALNDYLIRRFSISPQRLRGPMPIELRDFHRNDLAQLFAELGFKRGAEIGVAEGNYSEVLLKANPECELLLVDPWHAYAGNPQNKSNDKHEFAYNEVVRKTKDYPHVDIRQGYSMDVVDGIMLNELDFVYVDACHLFDDCVMDIIEWSKRVRSGGIVSGDDYYALDQKRWVGGGVVEAVQAYVNAHRIPIWYIFQGHKSVDFMWVKP